MAAALTPISAPEAQETHLAYQIPPTGFWIVHT